MKTEQMEKIMALPEFETVCENAMNGIDIGTLTKRELKKHQKWVCENWDNLNAPQEAKP